ncbi:MAG: BrnA antitoxin family protein [Alphaproteobacteria bacterium]|nr:BrnA antitoxin family protein [Alphaproteobacteria bacterium]
MRLSQVALRHFKATGEGWQTRLDKALRLLIGV